MTEDVQKISVRYLANRHVIFVATYFWLVSEIIWAWLFKASLAYDRLVKYFTTLYPNTLIFFVEKMRETFTLIKLLTFFQQKKILANFRY